MSENQFIAETEDVPPPELRRSFYSPENPQGFFDCMHIDTMAYGEKTLANTIGEQREDVEEVTSAIETKMSLLSKLHSHYISGRTEPCVVTVDDVAMHVSAAFRSLQEFIDELHEECGVADTKMLEDIQSRLGTWLSQHGRGRGPQPAPI